MEEVDVEEVDVEEEEVYGRRRSRLIDKILFIMVNMAATKSPHRWIRNVCDDSSLRASYK